MKIRMNVFLKTAALYFLIFTLAYSQIEVSEIKVIRGKNKHDPTDSGKQQEEYKEIFRRHRFVCYSPTNYDPNAGVFPDKQSIYADLKLLSRFFDGIVTYEATRIVPQIAIEAGLEYCVLGVWNPLSEKELKIAIEEANRDNSIIISIICGNEGLNRRYSIGQLKNAMKKIKDQTGLPVTTTEESGDYGNPEVLALGDYLAVNLHPYYAHKTDPIQAVKFVMRSYEILRRKTNKFVVIKETGLPTNGDPRISESIQDRFYQLLKRNDIIFWWFEAFDQEWKTHTSVEPYWGFFRSDRTSKQIVDYLESSIE